MSTGELFAPHHPGQVELDTNSQAQPLLLAWPNLLLRSDGLLGCVLRRTGAAVGNIVAERRAKFLVVVGKELRVIASTRDGDIGHAAVEQVLRSQLGVNVNQYTVGSLPLAGVAGHCIAMIEMQMPARIEFDRA